MRKLLVSGLLFIAVCLCAARQPEGEMRSLNGTRLFCRSVGEGIPVVVLHGGPGMDQSYFFPQMARFGAGYRLIFYDQRGQGRSSGDVDTTSMTMASYVEDLEALRKSYGLGKMNLLGHSFGGVVAMWYAATYPDRVRSLILLNTGPPSRHLRDSVVAVRKRRMNAEDRAELEAIVASGAFKEKAPDAMARYFRVLWRGTFRERRYADSLTFAFDGTYPARAALVARLAASMGDYDITSRLDMISCPTLIVGGANDPALEGVHELVHRHIPASEYVLLPDAGHFPFIETPGTLFPLLKAFLAKANR